MKKEKMIEFIQELNRKTNNSMNEIQEIIDNVDKSYLRDKFGFGEWCKYLGKIEGIEMVLIPLNQYFHEFIENGKGEEVV